VVTRRVAALDGAPANRSDAVDPAARRLRTPAAAPRVASGVAAIIGGPEVFGLFMDAYDTFWLSQAHRVTLRGGTGAFPGVPPLSPEGVLARHGLEAGETRVLDAAQAVDVTAWRRRSSSV